MNKRRITSFIACCLLTLVVHAQDTSNYCCKLKPQRLNQAGGWYIFDDKLMTDRHMENFYQNNAAALREFKLGQAASNRENTFMTMGGLGLLAGCVTTIMHPDKSWGGKVFTASLIPIFIGSHNAKRAKAHKNKAVELFNNGLLK